MTIQQLINDLQKAIYVHHFDPETPVQIDVLTYDGQNDNTHWNISVDQSAISKPRSFAINVFEDES
jgi:hypothetical protein